MTTAILGNPTHECIIEQLDYFNKLVDQYNYTKISYDDMRWAIINYFVTSHYLDKDDIFVCIILEEGWDFIATFTESTYVGNVFISLVNSEKITKKLG